MKPFLTVILAACVLVAAVSRCDGQRLEPRRWSHLPTGTNVAGGGYTYTSGEVFIDPVLRLEDTDFDLHAGALVYIRSFDLFGKTSRIDLLQGYAQAHWTGLLNGVPTSTSRTGWTDTNLRFSMLLLGAPPLEGAEFAEYRAAVAERETIVGIGLTVQLPTGHYEEDKLLNLGTNRFSLRPRIGFVHQRGKWSLELTAAAWFYTDNDDFFGGSNLETDPLYALEGHVVYNFKPGYWFAAGLGYGFGSESTIDGERKGDERGNLGFGARLGIPFNREWGMSLSYVGVRAQKSSGLDSDTIAIGISKVW